MARFDVFSGPAGTWLMDVRADQLERLGNYVLVPLLPLAAATRPIRGLNPVLDVDGTPCVMMTQLLAAAPRTAFRAPVDNLDRHWDDITRALDLLLTGF